MAYILTTSPSTRMISASDSIGRLWQTTWLTDRHVGMAMPRSNHHQVGKLAPDERTSWLGTDVKPPLAESVPPNPQKNSPVKRHKTY